MARSSVKLVWVVVFVGMVAAGASWAGTPASRPAVAADEAARNQFLVAKGQAERDCNVKVVAAAKVLRKGLEVADRRTNDPDEVKRVHDLEASVDAALAAKTAGTLGLGSDPPQSQPAESAWKTFDDQRANAGHEATAAVDRAKAAYAKELRRLAGTLAHTDTAKAVQLKRLADAVDEASGKDVATLVGGDGADQPAAVNLLKTVGKADAIAGTWRATGTGGFKAAGESGHPVRLQLGPVPRGEYDYTVRFTRSTDHSPVVTSLLCEHNGHRIAFCIGGGRGGRVDCGFDHVGGAPFFANLSSGQWAPDPSAGAAVTATVRVRDGYAVGEVNGQVVALSTADYGQYSVTGGWDVGRGRLGVNTNAADVAVLSASVSLAATDRGGGGGGRTVDLLGLIDSKRDVVQGNWTVGPRGEWACDDADGVKKIRSAYRPPAEYDYTVDFTLVDHRSSIVG